MQLQERERDGERAREWIEKRFLTCGRGIVFFT